MTIPATLPASTPPAVAPGVVADVKAILQGPAYGFCHDPAYPWTQSEAQWCAAVGQHNDRCDALPRACRGEMTLFERSVRYRRRSSGDGHEAENEPEPFTLKLPNIGGIGSVVLWAAIAVAVVLLLRVLLARAFGTKNRTPSSEPRADAPQPNGKAAKSAVEIDVERLLDRARRAAAEGRFDDGITDAYAALLRQLEGERLLRIDPWRTNGDYLRDLAPRWDVRTEVSRVVRDVESVQFGNETATGERFDAVYRQVSDLLAASVMRNARKAGVAATAGLACIALLFTSCSDVLHRRGPEDDSPSGTSAVVELLKRSGLEPRMRFRSLAKEIDADQVVLLPGAYVDDEAWKALMSWVVNGGSLVVANRDCGLAKALSVRFMERPELKRALSPGPGAPDAIRDASVVVPGANVLVIPEDNDDKEEWLVRDGTVYAASFEHGDGTIAVLADGFLFSNVSLAVADNAAFLMAFLQGDQKKIDLVGELTGSGAKSPLASVERGKLAPVLLQLGLVLVLFFLYKGVAFGTLTDPQAGKRRSFAEHARALGLLYAKAHASGHARSVYGAYVLERLRDSMAFRDQKGISALADVVAARSGQPLGQVALLLVEAQEVRPLDPKEKASQEDLDLIRRLSRLLRQTKGGSK